MTTGSILLLVTFSAVVADPNIRSSRESWRQEFKSFTDVIQKSMRTFQEKVNADLKSKDSRSNVAYTRWGKKTCPLGAELVFSGYAGGSWYMDAGAAVNPLCLPRDPEWGVYRDGVDRLRAFVYGGEYETNTAVGKLPTVHMHDVPCAFCLLHSTSIVKMFPARNNCYKGWKMEYQGYLMAGEPGYKAGSMYTCVDGHPDTVHGGHANGNGYLFYMVEARCGSLKCPPYVNGRELVCVVCSKE